MRNEQQINVLNSETATFFNNNKVQYSCSCSYKIITRHKHFRVSKMMNVYQFNIVDRNILADLVATFGPPREYNGPLSHELKQNMQAHCRYINITTSLNVAANTRKRHCQTIVRSICTYFTGCGDIVNWMIKSICYRSVFQQPPSHYFYAA